MKFVKEIFKNHFTQNSDLPMMPMFEFIEIKTELEQAGYITKLRKISCKIPEHYFYILDIYKNKEKIGDITAIKLKDMPSQYALYDVEENIICSWINDSKNEFGFNRHEYKNSIEQAKKLVEEKKKEILSQNKSENKPEKENNVMFSDVFKALHIEQERKANAFRSTQSEDLGTISDTIHIVVKYGKEAPIFSKDVAASVRADAAAVKEILRDFENEIVKSVKDEDDFYGPLYEDGHRVRPVVRVIIAGTTKYGVKDVVMFKQTFGILA